MTFLRSKYRKIMLKEQDYLVSNLPHGTIREELMYQMVPRIC